MTTPEKWTSASAGDSQPLQELHDVYVEMVNGAIETGDSDKAMSLAAAFEDEVRETLLSR